MRRGQHGGVGGNDLEVFAEMRQLSENIQQVDTQIAAISRGLGKGAVVTSES